MSERLLRIVIDTNTLLRGLLSATSAAAKVRRAAEERLFIPLLSKPVVDEYRAVLLDPAIIERFPEIDQRLAEVTVRRLRFVSDYVPHLAFDSNTAEILATRSSLNWQSA